MNAINIKAQRTRWTKAELEEIDDLVFAICILSERQDKLDNYYGFLSQKITSAKNTICDLAEQTRKWNDDVGFWLGEKVN